MKFISKIQYDYQFQIVTNYYISNFHIINAVAHINVSHGWIYYGTLKGITETGTHLIDLYKIKLDATEKQLVK